MVHLKILVESSYVNSALPFALLSMGGTSKEPLRSAVNAVVSASANEANAGEDYRENKSTKFVHGEPLGC